MTEQNTNQTLIETTLQLMSLSSMTEEERNMWTIMLPSMETAEIEKLKTALEAEVKAMTELYLQTKQADT